MPTKTIALIGNQNCGKTTLFNALTGSNQHVGNFPGVTVEQKSGTIKKHPSIKLVDLPGIYSLTPYTMEEIVSTDFLIKEKPSMIINIIDATSIERNLYLTTQLLELNIPMILALNMMDEVISSGNSIDVEGLQQALGIRVIPLSASKNEGIEELIEAIETTLKENNCSHLDLCSGEIHKAIHSITHLIEDNAVKAKLPKRFAVTKIIEGDKDIIRQLHLDVQQLHIIKHIIEDMEEKEGLDKDAALVDMRYQVIENITRQTVFKEQETAGQVRSEKIDSILTHKYFGIPIFIVVMLMIFFLTFNVIGAPLQSLMEIAVDFIGSTIITFLTNHQVAPWLISLLRDGVIAGVGSVLSFLPLIVVLFFFLSMLEDSGYMARVAFVMDKLLRKIGLSGKSFVPMLIGFGCSVPAIMASRTLSSQRDRKMTIIVTPFMSCSAKLPIYGMIIAAFFSTKAPLVMITIYCIGILVAIFSALLLKATIFPGDPIPFVMELPSYRIPTAKNVIMHMWEKAKDFLKKAFTIIFIASLLIWFLQSFNFRFEMVTDSSKSILAYIGNKLSFIFAPLGFSDWRLSTSLITGITAKESVVSTLSVLTNSSSPDALYHALNTLLTPASAFAFLTFTVLYMPCVAAFAATKRELGSWLQAILTAGYQTGIAYVVAFIVYHLALLIS
ncbi:ferrous iron transport protein B [uncultured Thomasclavelia sp.]|uniref:ferrous iron transport protein B n=1 Tax=uncultured Thomasclavelia sp. TaxID=3025759 RepID=UPI00259367D5|nr:ferrous iron transport protein B [uncultured Thomasclavelia sp.]